MAFPAQRPCRLRRTPVLRRLVRETALSVDDLVAPLFVREGAREPVEVASMPGQVQHTIESARKEAAECAALGIPAVVLFGVPATKDATGSGADREDGIVQRALRELRAEAGDALVLISDLCLDEYTDHGHCGVVRDGRVDNDATLDRYRAIAASQAAAGADIVAPSGMMDGQVAAIREALDSAGFAETAIMSYAAKFASAMYGPFRDAAECAPRFGDRAGYQMDPANAREAVREALADVEEGADIVMVKPALAYLDIVRAVAEATRVPLAAYNVSGEYAMLKAAAAAGWIDEPRAMMEVLGCIRRAGADMVITYHAKDAARMLLRGREA
ncbi:MAG: porphobilinogen synthase [Acidobacteria bacterium]|nr:porphobilinogen synthase [Acidobacteriota bacterium]